jgi:hypothetical protein
MVFLISFSAQPLHYWHIKTGPDFYIDFVPCYFAENAY